MILKKRGRDEGFLLLFLLTVILTNTPCVVSQTPHFIYLLHHLNLQHYWRPSAVYKSVAGLVTKSCLTLVTLWTVAHQARLPMGFYRQEHWSGLPFPSPGDLPDPGIKLRVTEFDTDFDTEFDTDFDTEFDTDCRQSPALQVDSLLTEPQGWPYIYIYRERVSYYYPFFPLISLTVDRIQWVQYSLHV